MLIYNKDSGSITTMFCKFVSKKSKKIIIDKIKLIMILYSKTKFAKIAVFTSSRQF